MFHTFFVALISALLQFNSASAALDTNWMADFDLTEQQIQILESWVAQGKFGDDFILRSAQIFENYNNRPQVYIPEHTSQDIVAVTNWAAGSAYAAFAVKAGYNFDRETFEQDCPHRALYNFGYATERLYLKQDVLQKFFSTFNILAWLYRSTPDTFAQDYWERARSDGFEKYLSPISESMSLSSL